MPKTITIKKVKIVNVNIIETVEDDKSTGYSSHIDYDLIGENDEVLLRKSSLKYMKSTGFSDRHLSDEADKIVGDFISKYEDFMTSREKL